LGQLLPRELDEGEYGRLTSALIEVRGDTVAASSFLGTDPERLKAWLACADRELRNTLVAGRLEDGEILGEAIATVLRVQEGGSDDELAEHRIHSEGVRWLVGGISDINNRDLTAGTSQLMQLTESIYCSESLRWVAWFWIAKAAAEQGDLDRALSASASALALSARLDDHALSLSHCNAAEAYFLAGDHDKALERLQAATELTEGLENARGLSQIWLSRARIETDQGNVSQAATSAEQALEVDPANEEAIVFLASLSLGEGDVKYAKQLLAPLVDQDSPSAEAVREMRLTTMVERSELAPELLRQYNVLRARPPSDATLKALRQLATAHPDFLQLRELLAWSLTRMGEDEEAAGHFQQLVEQSGAAELQRSALLGLGCLANSRHAHRQPGRWIRNSSLARDHEGRGSSAGGRDQALAGLDVDELEGAVDQLFEGSAPAGRETIPRDEWLELDAADLIEQPDDKVDAAPRGPLGSFGATEGSAEQAVVRPEPPSETRLPTSERPAVGGAKVAFSGQLQLLAVPDLLEFLKASRRTGTLMLTSAEGIGAIHLRNGWITSAASPNGTTIGELLVEQGAVEQSQLDEAAVQQQSEQPNRLLGAVLVGQGIVDEGAVTKALRKQVLSALIELVQWQSGDFAFEPDKTVAAENDEIDVEFDTQGMLLDALREIDERARDA
jgi:tetratricopeptide (TPR) repeat protein